MQEKSLHIYTDGSSYPKIKVGAWAYLVMDNNNSLVFKNSGLVMEHATNNRMELQAIVEAMEMVPACQKITIYSDSEFALRVVQGKKMSNENPLDPSLLDRLKTAKNKFQEIHFQKVKAHSKDILNTAVDKLARRTLRSSNSNHEQHQKIKLF